MTQKHKTCVGCLSFEEKNIDENIKKELMESFENALLTPEMQGRYNILWVEHTDKGGLELNFVIPKIDLESKKAFNPFITLRIEKKLKFGAIILICVMVLQIQKTQLKNKHFKEAKKQRNFLKTMRV